MYPVFPGLDVPTAFEFSLWDRSMGGAYYAGPYDIAE